MQAFTLLLVLAAIVAAFRVYVTLRRMRTRDQDDWDERLVKNLRAQGGDPFQPREVDFFFDLPDEARCQALSVDLGAAGYAVDYHPLDPGHGTGWSLHARRELRISVPEMQASTSALRALAAKHGGSYDGWATAGMNRETIKRQPPAR